MRGVVFSVLLFLSLGLFLGHAQSKAHRPEAKRDTIPVKTSDTIPVKAIDTIPVKTYRRFAAASSRFLAAKTSRQHKGLNQGRQS
jgi:hypothetical protein